MRTSSLRRHRPAFDQITATSDTAIGQAQLGIDANVNGTELQKAQAASIMANAQAAATVGEAQAQATLDLATSAANTAQAAQQAQDAAAQAAAAATTSSTVGTTTTTPNAPAAPTVNYYFTIHGNGKLTAPELMTEVGWALKVGAIPVAAPGI